MRFRKINVRMCSITSGCFQIWLCDSDVKAVLAWEWPIWGKDFELFIGGGECLSTKLPRQWMKENKLDILRFLACTHISLYPSNVEVNLGGWLLTKDWTSFCSSNSQTAPWSLLPPISGFWSINSHQKTPPHQASLRREALLQRWSWPRHSWCINPSNGKQEARVVCK